MAGLPKSLTDVAGSSACFAYGIVSYSNGAKESLLGVAPKTLLEHGAVSEDTVREMAEGVLALSGADHGRCRERDCGALMAVQRKSRWVPCGWGLRAVARERTQRK